VTRWVGWLAAFYCGRGWRLQRIALLCVASCFVVFAVSAGSAAAKGDASTSRGTSAASSDCSEATARQVVEPRLDVNIFDLPDPVRQVLCGPFTGPGSNAMAVTIGAPTCWGIQNWAVFRFAAGDWQLVLNQPAYLVPPLVAVGSDIQETTAVHRSGDPRCFFKGGTHARIWHWDGTQLVAGTWKQVAKGEPITRIFYTPSKNIYCSLGDSSDYLGVTCVSFKAPQSVKMDASGKLKICRGRRCLGCGCAPEDIPTLGYGRQITVGRFRCRSQQSGVTCAVIQSGRGFLISRAGVRPVGP
jgi:hypothetical protein